MLLKQNLVIIHIQINPKFVPVLSLLVAGSFNILLHKIQFFSPNFLMRKLSVNGEFQQTFQWLSRKSTKTVGLRKTSSTVSWVKNIVFYTVFVEFTDAFYFHG